MTKNKILFLENVRFSFDNKNFIIDGLTLSVFENEIITIIGKSGSGKTTLLNLICEQLIPNGGLVHFYNYSPIFDSKINYLFQQPVLLSYRTALENALLCLELHKKVEGSTLSEIIEMFKIFGLGSDTHKFPDELSGGMRQRVGLIQTITLNSAMYLLDEPFTAVDRNTSSFIENFLWKKIKEKKSSALIATHDLEQAVSMSDRIIALSDTGNLSFEIKFDNEFRELSPSARRKSELFMQYLVQIIKNISIS